MGGREAGRGTEKVRVFWWGLVGDANEAWDYKIAVKLMQQNGTDGLSLGSHKHIRWCGHA